MKKTKIIGVFIVIACFFASPVFASDNARIAEGVKSWFTCVLGGEGDVSAAAALFNVRDAHRELTRTAWLFGTVRPHSARKWKRADVQKIVLYADRVEVELILPKDDFVRKGTVSEWNRRITDLNPLFLETEKVTRVLKLKDGFADFSDLQKIRKTLERELTEGLAGSKNNKWIQYKMKEAELASSILGDLIGLLK